MESKYHSPSIGQISKALSKAQSEFLPALKSSSNPFYKSKYADLNSIVNACKEALRNASISYNQITDTIDGVFTMITILSHESGEWIKSYTPIIFSKQDSQAMGSAITYTRRYALSSMLGVVTDEDDDGNATVRKISLTQAAELTSMISKCPENIRENIYRSISKELNIHALCDMPLSFYEKIKLSISKCIPQVCELQSEAV